GSLASSGTCGGTASAAAHQAPTVWACTRSAGANRPKPIGKQRLGGPLQAARVHQVTDLEGVGGKAVAGGKRQPRRYCITGQQGRRDSVSGAGPLTASRPTAAPHRVAARPAPEPLSSGRPSR